MLLWWHLSRHSCAFTVHSMQWSGWSQDVMHARHVPKQWLRQFCVCSSAGTFDFCWQATEVSNITTRAAIKGAMSRPAHVQDFCLLCWFSQLSAILDLGNQADFWQQISVYNTVLSEFLLVYLSIFFVEFYRSCRREIMISDEAALTAKRKRFNHSSNDDFCKELTDQFGSW